MEKCISKLVLDEDNLSIKRQKFYSDKQVSNLLNIIIVLISLLLGSIGSIICLSNSVVDSQLKLSYNISLIDSLQSNIDSLEKIEYEYTMHNLIGHYSSSSKLEELNLNNLKDLLIKCYAWYPEIIIAQAKIESRLGTSNVYKHSNNLFGIKRVNKDSKSTQVGISNSGYGIYKNWQLSVIDRVLLDHRVFKKKPSKNEYIRFLQDRYAEDNNYIEKLNSIIEKSK